MKVVSVASYISIMFLYLCRLSLYHPDCEATGGVLTDRSFDQFATARNAVPAL